MRATKYKTLGSNRIIRFPTAMVYSICLLEEADFENFSREISKGAGVDCSLGDGTKATKQTREKYSKKRKAEEVRTEPNLFQVLNDGTKAESKLATLRLMLEFGSVA